MRGMRLMKELASFKRCDRGIGNYDDGKWKSLKRIDLAARRFTKHYGSLLD